MSTLLSLMDAVLTRRIAAAATRETQKQDGCSITPRQNGKMARTVCWMLISVISKQSR